MDKFTYINNANPAYIEELYQNYLKNPDSVDDGWKKFFEGFEFSSLTVKSKTATASTFYNTDSDSQNQKEIRVSKLINAYRERGHLVANTNPIRPRRKHRADLDLSSYQLSESDLDLEFNVAKDLGFAKQSTLREILDHLNKTYCSTIGVEYKQINTQEISEWLHKAVEPNKNDPNLSTADKQEILKKLNQSVGFENFLHTKFVGQKRFSLEGLEAFIPGLDSMINYGADLGVQEFVIGMAHRGRLNVLVNIFGKPYEQLFSEFGGVSLPSEIFGDGDVKYHLGRSSDIITRNGKKVHLSLTPNPSHLEAVNPVVEGIVRAKAEQLYKKDFTQVCPILIHGDAALAGQGIIYEVCNMAYLDGYKTGGTVHVVLNNQIGFTANYKESRSSLYCTDIAKVLEAPVFHVNADDPEAVVHVMKLAVELRQKFACDVFVDILGYRKFGHNEGDEPRFTQPVLYNLIDQHKNIYQLYLEKCISEKVISEADASLNNNTLKDLMQSKLELAKASKKMAEVDYLKRNWTGVRASKEDDFLSSPDTSFNADSLAKIAKALVSVPKEFNLYSKMKKVLDQRETLFFKEQKVDWGLAELLAYGTLLNDGYQVRISGQDSQRGTFTHRHAYLKDEKNEKEYVPLNNINETQGKIEIYNSHLAEYAVLGFEYGYSLALPKSLVIWEAQFGDFANGAQIIFDQFISASESKWQRMSGITVLLPHGFEGQGPEHSSGRVERFLTLCGQNNMYVCNVTTPANYFHLLRRQMILEFRKPLIVMTPKSLLRHPLVQSSIENLSQGSFKEILDDDMTVAKKIKRVVLCSGKIYYDLLEYKTTEKRDDVALIRIEQLYPIQTNALDAVKLKYKAVKDWVWVQEEPENMGPWAFINRKLRDLQLGVIARKESSSPATGSPIRHADEQHKLVVNAFTLS